MIRNINIAQCACVRRVFAAISCSGIILFSGCHRAPSDNGPKVAASEHTAASAVAAKEESDGVKLTSEQAEKMGIATEAAKSNDYTAETAGYGVVIAHETIATAVAELTSAKAAARQSQAALSRSQRLAGTPGAMSADAVESAARQSATDSAALSLAEHRLSSIIGAGPAGRAVANDATLQELASGRVKLVRTTFPLGALPGPAPATLRAAHLDALSSSVARPAEGWQLKSVWNAPADASLPGRSFFALLRGGDAGEGERLLIWAPGSGPSQQGAVVSVAAVVIRDAKYWCYVEKKPGVYVRREVATDKPVANGYFVTEGVAPGDKVVTAGAGLLLARESNPSSEAE